jgi:glycosyltransferase involved in cell wall biosynthesis
MTNYNYGRFLAAAIESAVAVRADDKEIIVCDDGSKDDSRAIIERYADRLTKVIFKQNGGQPSAANAAFEHATGDLIFFLDSDDMYLPQIAERVLAVWHDGVAKVQFPMLNADGDGKLSGTMFPNFTVAFEPAAIRKTLFETGLYPTTPTTGNGYSRKFLQHIFPMPERLTEGFDILMNPTAPLGAC